MPCWERDAMLRKKKSCVLPSLRWREQNVNLAAIQGGINDMENGRYRPFADFDAEFRERNQIKNDA